MAGGNLHQSYTITAELLTLLQPMMRGIYHDGWLTGVVATQELDLKVRQFNTLLRGPPALSDAANVNMLWAHLMVDELCRLGASTFCIAPGQPACCGQRLVAYAQGV